MILIQKTDTNEMENHEVDPTGGRLAVRHPRLTRPLDITKETDQSPRLIQLRSEENSSNSKNVYLYLITLQFKDNFSPHLRRKSDA